PLQTRGLRNEFGTAMTLKMPSLAPDIRPATNA
ncbi:MAG: hypothetical protein ACI855_004440, partial [Myxococcota bacterium]